MEMAKSSMPGEVLHSQGAPSLFSLLPGFSTRCLLCSSVLARWCCHVPTSAGGVWLPGALNSLSPGSCG